MVGHLVAGLGFMRNLIVLAPLQAIHVFWWNFFFRISIGFQIGTYTSSHIFPDPLQCLQSVSISSSLEFCFIHGCSKTCEAVNRSLGFGFNNFLIRYFTSLPRVSYSGYLKHLFLVRHGLHAHRTYLTPFGGDQHLASLFLWQGVVNSSKVSGSWFLWYGKSPTIILDNNAHRPHIDSYCIRFWGPFSRIF